MSTKYPGGFITKSPVAPTTSAASGIWTLDQQEQAQKAGTWPSPPIFIEDLFSTYLNTPTTSNTAYSINNGIDLSGNGGMVWFKSRSSAGNNYVYDTARGSSSGSNNVLVTNSTNAQQTANYDYLTFGSSGFTVNYATGGGQLTNNGINYVSWTFREQPKFFDVVTYTGDGTSNRAISHNLGAVPGCIILKRYDGAVSWQVYHRATPGTPQDNTLQLNTSDAMSTSAGYWGTTAFTDTQFRVSSFGGWNASGGTYVAYLFAHNAGGFPASGSGSTNGISCGSFTTDGSGNATIDLGYEPQWVLLRPTGSAYWRTMDVMRGFPVGAGGAYLFPNTTDAEGLDSTQYYSPTSTGFAVTNGGFPAGATVIYIAIRRGPMKTPSTGTSVFLPQVRTGTGSTTTVTTGLNSDSMWFRRIVDGQAATLTFGDKLRGTTKYLETANTNSEQTYATQYVNQYLNTGVTIGNGTEINQSYVASNIGSWYLTRAPGFFDEVCYTGDGNNRTITHNLTVAPEMMIVKSRSGVYEWSVYSAPQGASARTKLNLSDAQQTGTFVWNYTAPTSTVFSLGTASAVNDSAYTYVAYLFATLAGVSKVGSYTGTGALLTVNCGFTSGARFVLIKRTDSTGDWYVYDTARGMTSGNDPYFFTNTSDGAVTSTNYVDTDTTGFKVTAAAPAGLNASGGTYIFLAIA